MTELLTTETVFSAVEKGFVAPARIGKAALRNLIDGATPLVSYDYAAEALAQPDDVPEEFRAYGISPEVYQRHKRAESIVKELESQKPC